jgi:NADPH-dependent glutamate synthase beta subunit-like oxidoreductase
MVSVNLNIDGQPVQVPAGTTVLQAARNVDIYIPTLCHHPNLPPAKDCVAASEIFQGARKLVNALPEEPGKGCGLCVVEMRGNDELIDSCSSIVEEGMAVVTENERIKAKRQERLVPIMTRHPHACLTCNQQEGCPRSQCSANVPENERCCPQFGNCELQKVVNYVGIPAATPKWIPTDIALLENHPLFERDYNLCIGCTRCVRACRDLRGIEAIGFVFDEHGQIQVGSLAETLQDSGCKFCTACVEVCPTGALVDKAVKPATKEKDLVPCKAECPVHIDVPGYLRLIAEGRADEAKAVIREKVPLPGVLGRVCIHPCEDVCRRGDLNESISICALKRFAADGENGLWKNKSKVAPDTGKKVAVVGAGPAGLTAAYYLRKQGHAVSMFDSNSQAGGMLRYGIPEYRLPRSILDQEIKDILDLGIEFRPNRSLGKNLFLGQLKTDGFNAIFLGLGAQQSRRIPLKGSDSPNVLWGIEFLRKVAEGEVVSLKSNVVVIGGGNLAVDAAMTARRCGATQVKIACLECLMEMPANPWELDAARAEGIAIMPSWGPKNIAGKDGQITGMDLVECTCLYNEKGDFCPEFGEKKESILVDQVIMAIGQTADLSFIEESTPIRVSRRLMVVNEESLETGMPGVYAGGDAVALSGTVVHAIAAGRQAAESIDKALGGSGQIDETLFSRANPDSRLGRDEGFAAWARERVPELNAEIRVEGFDEIAIGFSTEQAMKEAKRCLQCDLRLNIGSNPSPPAKYLPFDEVHVNQVPETEGVFRLLDVDYRVLGIKGTANLRQELLKALENNDPVFFFEFEKDKMYSRRENELIQKYIQEHGKMPDQGVDDLDYVY